MFLTVDFLGQNVDVFPIDVLEIDVIEVVNLGRPGCNHRHLIYRPRMLCQPAERGTQF
jgi:hypothetical protein